MNLLHPEGMIVVNKANPAYGVYRLRLFTLLPPFYLRGMEKAKAQDANPSKEEPETIARPKQGQLPFDRSDYIAFVALVISLVGTLVSVRETQILYEQQAVMVAEKSASVLPYVSVKKIADVRGDTAVHLSLNIVKDGIGPALLNTLSLKFKGRLVRADSLAAAVAESGFTVRQLLSNNKDLGILPVNSEPGFLPSNSIFGQPLLMRFCNWLIALRRTSATAASTVIVGPTAKRVGTN